MAKKQTKVAPTPAPAPAPPTPTVERGLNDKFVRTFANGKPVPFEKGPPQMKVIANTLEAAGKTGLTRAELIKNLTGVLVTRQPVGRILSYYQKDLVNGGYVTMVKEAAPATPKAPAKEEAEEEEEEEAEEEAE